MTSATSGNTSAATASSSARQGLVSTAVGGALLGVAASMVMAAYAMIASATYQHHGFFTPLYHIASTIISPSTLMTSMQNGASGSTFYFAFGPALLDAVIHMMMGAMYGALFAVIVSRIRVRAMMLVPAGAAWGVVVFAVSSFILLPLTATVLGSGDQITQMAKLAGYGNVLRRAPAFRARSGHDAGRATPVHQRHTLNQQGSQSDEGTTQRSRDRRQRPHSRSRGQPLLPPR